MWHLRSRKNQIFQLYQLYVFCHVWRWQKSETETKFACLHAEWYMRQNNALHGINSHCTEKFRNNFPTSVAFFDPQMHPDATYAFRFLMLHDLAKTKILSANKSRDVERYVCRTTALHPRQSPLTRDIATKFRWDGHLQDISIVSGIPLPFRCNCRRKVFSSALRRGRFLSRCPPVKRLFGVQASRRTTLHSALTSYRCGSL